MRTPSIAFRFLVLMAALVGLLSVPTGCKSCNKATGGRTRIAVSIFPLYDIVRRIAGPDADVTLILPPGHTEHTFDPTPKDVEEASEAKIGVMIGLGLDPWMEKLMKDAAPTAKILKVGERVPTLVVKDDPIGDEAAHKVIPEDDHDHDKGATDPHVWMDPARVRVMVKAIGDELAKVDSEHANGYRERSTQVDGEIEKLDKEIEAQTAAWTTRGFITFHGSFNYFADRYKLQIIAVIEPFPGSTPTGEYIEEVLKVVKEKKVGALFGEPQLDPRPAKTIADEAKIPVGTLDPVGGTPETDTYEKLIRFNANTLEKYLK
ncbi:zinc ABC transporter substrate-binding protein [soil metagenome]